MKWLFYIFLVFLAGILFLPSHTGEPRNLPLLIAIVSTFVLFWLLRFIRTFVFACRTAHLLKKQSFKIKKMIVFFKTAYIVAENDNCVYSISMYRGINQKYRYHFEKANVLEVYKTTRTTFSGRRFSDGGSGAKMTHTVYSGETMTKLAMRKKFKTLKTNDTKKVCKMILMSDFPTYITDSENDLHREPIGQGDAICSSDTVIYSLDGLRDHFGMP